MMLALRRYLLLPALLLYCGALLFAATPGVLTPDAVEPAQHEVRRLFRQDLNLRPWAFVFAGRRGRWKRRSVMLTAHARMPGGELKRVLAAPAEPPSGFRWWRPAEETYALKSLVLSPANKLMMTPSRRGRRRQIHRARKHPRLSRLSRFACRSQYAGGGEADRVYLTIAYDTIDYQTGRIRDAAHVIQVYDCRRDRPLLSSRWPAADVDAEGLPRPRPGVRDVVVQPRTKRGRGKNARRGRGEKTRRGRGEKRGSDARRRVVKPKGDAPIIPPLKTLPRRDVLRGGQRLSAPAPRSGAERAPRGPSSLRGVGPTREAARRLESDL